MTAAIIFLIILSALVLIHEAGHFFAARLFGVKADEFGYGLPPRIVGMVKVGRAWKKVGAKDQKKYANTIWSFNWLPIGGFVRIKGESGENDTDPDSFHAKPIWQRIIILAAGVSMNWVLAAALLSVGLMIGVPSLTDGIPEGAIVHKTEVTIGGVLPGGAAAEAGLQPMDILVSVGGVQANSLDQTRQEIFARGEAPVEIVFERGKDRMAVTVTPKYVEELGRTGLGVSLLDTGIVSYPPVLAVKNGIILTGLYTKAVVITFLDLFRELLNGDGTLASQVSGPVGIAAMTGDVAERGFANVLQFTAILSINLAVLNFLPIPALDGGRVMFLILEGLRRKPMNRRVEAIVHNTAFLILIALIILITLRDIGRVFGG